MTSIVQGVKQGLDDLGNESMFPMIELMREVGWNVIDNPVNQIIHKGLIGKVEQDFSMLYNSYISVGGQKSIHEDLYNMLKLLDIKSVPDSQLFEKLIVRGDDGKMLGFSDRFKNLLANSPEGLKMSLNLSNDCKNLGIKINLFPKNMYDRQPRGLEGDAICKKMIENELTNDFQKSHLAHLIADKGQISFKDKICSDISKLPGLEKGGAEYQQLISNVISLVDNIDDNNNLTKCINELAKLNIVQNNAILRSYLGSTLFVPENFEDSEKVLQIIDPARDITEFKPNLVGKAKDKISYQIFSAIKSDMSQRIYNNDSLIERYLPTSIRGLRNNEQGLQNKIEWQAMQILSNNNAEELIVGRIVEDYRKANPTKNLPSYTKDAYRLDSDNFKQIFFHDSTSLDKLLNQARLIQNIGLDDYTRDILSKPPKEAIAKLCQDVFNNNESDKLYKILLVQAGEAINLNDFLDIQSGKAIGVNKQALDKLLDKPGAETVVLNNLLLSRVNKTDFDLKREIYRHNDIHTREGMIFHGSNPSFEEDNRLNRLFRNHVETFQHVRNSGAHETAGGVPEAGDTHHSNESRTMIPDIAVIYANIGQPNNSPCYSWIEITGPQLGINCTEYIEHHRMPAQEFAMPNPNPSAHLGGVCIEKVKDLDNDFVEYRIVDGYLSNEAYNYMQNNQVPAPGLENKTEYFLHAAYAHQKAAYEGKKLNENEISQLAFESDNLALSRRVDRTNYQNIYDNYDLRKPSTYASEVNYTNALRWKKYYESNKYAPNSAANYYSQMAQNLHSQERQNIQNWQKRPELANKYWRNSEPQLGYSTEVESFFKNKTDQQFMEYLQDSLSNNISSKNDSIIVERMNYAVEKLQNNGKDITNFQNIIEQMPIDQLNFNLLPEYIKIVEEKTKSKFNISNKLQEELNKSSLERFSNQKVAEPFLDNLKTTFDFIDTSDLLVSMRENNSFPWRKYQAPNIKTDQELDRWNQAKALSNDGLTPAEQYKQLFETLVGNSVAGELPARTYPITAGGSYDVNGVIDPQVATYKSCTTRYFPISKYDFENLKQNKLITILEAHEINNPNVKGNVLCKYRYPDMRDTNTKLAEYTQDLDPQTKKEVDELLNSNVASICQAVGLNHIVDPTKLKDLSNEDFLEITVARRELQELNAEWNGYDLPRTQRLENAYNSNPAYRDFDDKVSKINEKVITHTLKKILEDQNLSPLDRYQSLVSLHALPDMNGRCNRMLYQREAGKTCYMLSWDQDLVATQETMDQEYSNYVNMMGALNEEHIRAKNARVVPKYYENPKLWLATFGVNPDAYSKEEISNLSRVMFKTIDSQDVQDNIRTKDYLAYSSKIMGAIYNSHDFKITSQQDKHKNSAIHQACLYGKDLDKLLIKADEQGINLLDHKNNYGQTPIHVAAFSNNFKAIEKCLKHEPLLRDSKDYYNKTFYDNIMENIVSSNEYTFEQFLKFSDKVLASNGYDISKYIYNGQSKDSLADVLIKEGKYDKAKILLASNQNFPIKIDSLESAITEIAKSNDIDLQKQNLEILNEIIKSSNKLDPEEKKHCQLLIKKQKLNTTPVIETQTEIPTASTAVQTMPISIDNTTQPGAQISSTVSNTGDKSAPNSIKDLQKFQKTFQNNSPTISKTGTRGTSPHTNFASKIPISVNRENNKKITNILNKNITKFLNDNKEEDVDYNTATQLFQDIITNLQQDKLISENKAQEIMNNKATNDYIQNIVSSCNLETQNATIKEKLIVGFSNILKKSEPSINLDSSIVNVSSQILIQNLQDNLTPLVAQKNNAQTMQSNQQASDKNKKFTRPFNTSPKK